MARNPWWQSQWNEENVFFINALKLSWWYVINVNFDLLSLRWSTVEKFVLKFFFRMEHDFSSVNMPWIVKYEFYLKVDLFTWNISVHPVFTIKWENLQISVFIWYLVILHWRWTTLPLLVNLNHRVEDLNVQMKILWRPGTLLSSRQTDWKGIAWVLLSKLVITP